MPRARLVGLILAAVLSPAVHGAIVETRLPSGRPLTVAVPENVEPGAPIVVSLHYGGPAGPYYGRGLLEQVVAPGLRALDAVMLAPDCPASSWADATCAADALAAIDLAVSRYRADPSRVLLTGYSKGGIGAWALSDAHPERFAAVIVMAGRDAGIGWGDATPVPAYVLHGAGDELFPAHAVRAAANARRVAGQDVTVQVLDGVTHYDTGAFVAPLARAVPWVAEQLGRAP